MVLGRVAGTLTEPFSIFGYVFDTDERYFYVVLGYVIVMYVLGTNLMRTRDGRALSPCATITCRPK
jgi:branched-chain amino acid transport system permease protein